MPYSIINKSYVHRKIVKLLFSGPSANEAYISYISTNYNIKASIIYGNIEVINEKPIGCLFVLLSGEEKNVLDAISYLVSENVKVTEIKEAENDE